VKTLSCLFAVGLTLCTIGCGAPAANRPQVPSPVVPGSDREFPALQRQYTDRFHAAMVTGAEQLSEKEILAEGARLWGEVFDPHEDVLRRRAAEVIAALDAAPAIAWSRHLVVAETCADTDGTPSGGFLKQFAWNPTLAAQRALDQWLGRILHTPSLAKRSLLVASAPPAWEALERDPDRPKLTQRMGPLVFIAELSRDGAYYRVDRLVWLRPKSMGLIALPPAPSPAAIGRPATASTE